MSGLSLPWRTELAPGCGRGRHYASTLPLDTSSGIGAVCLIPGSENKHMRVHAHGSKTESEQSEQSLLRPTLKKKCITLLG